MSDIFFRSLLLSMMDVSPLFLYCLASSSASRRACFWASLSCFNSLLLSTIDPSPEWLYILAISSASFLACFCLSLSSFSSLLLSTTESSPEYLYVLAISSASFLACFCLSLSSLSSLLLSLIDTPVFLYCFAASSASFFGQLLRVIQLFQFGTPIKCRPSSPTAILPRCLFRLQPLQPCRVTSLFLLHCECDGIVVNSGR
mmetsp:Transcript_18793/g.38172  ORF Transcript_18793/g.38172 Transcript_18793/m.38172 type:complete len:201 (-) Transcript_18793:222-824(-)